MYIYMYNIDIHTYIHLCVCIVFHDPRVDERTKPRQTFATVRGDNIICGFNSPPSQNQLHLQWILGCYGCKLQGFACGVADRPHVA